MSRSSFSYRSSSGSGSVRGLSGTGGRLSSARIVSSSSSGGGSAYPFQGRAQSLILGQSRRISAPLLRSSGYGASSGFSSGYSGGLIQKSTNIDLNSPLPQNDTTLQSVRLEESRQIKGLNNQFVKFIDQVRYLEQVNKKLEVKLNLLKEQGDYKSNIDSMFQTYIDNLKRQLETLGQEKLRFEADLVQMQGLVEDFKGKYEDEINKRTEMENEFVLVKKDVDDSYMSKVELEAKLESLTDEIDFLRSIFEEEIRELQAQIQNTSVSVQLDSGPKLDIEQLIAEAKIQYENMANQSRKEAEIWKQTKMQELSMSSGQYGDELRMTKDEIKQMNQRIRALNNDIESLRNERLKLEALIKEAEERGELSLRGAKDRIEDLKSALANAQQQLMKQVQEYEALLQVKLYLDVEISTYKSLLEGEEERMISGVKTLNIQQVQNQGNFQQFRDMSSGLESSLGLGGSGGGRSSQTVIVKSVEQSRGGYLSSY
ncbi:keratin, type II cytoskeletal 8-like [Cetorhinus maximus]